MLVILLTASMLTEGSICMSGLAQRSRLPVLKGDGQRLVILLSRDISLKYAKVVLPLLIIAWNPDHFNRGTVFHFNSHTIDVIITLVEIASASYPKDNNGNVVIPTEGKSLVPHLEGRAIDNDRPVLFEQFENRGVIRGNMKLVS